MANRPNDTDAERFTYRRRTVMGGIAAGAGLRALNVDSNAQVHGMYDLEWVPEDASEVHAAVLSGFQAGVETGASGCAHVTPTEAETLMVDVFLEGIECVTQAHIHEGERGEDGPIVATLFEFTAEPDGSGEGDPLSTEPDTPLIQGAEVDDPELVDDILRTPHEYYVNVHTVHNPGGEIRGQITGFERGQDTEIEPKPAEFTVSGLDPEDVEVVRGDNFDVSARIRNVGDISDTQTVELRIDDDVVAQQDVELDCRSSRIVEFDDIDTQDLEPGEYEHGVFTEDDSQIGTLTILRPAEFLVSDLDPQDVTVTRGDLIDVSATIENVGDVSDSQTIEFRVNDDVVSDQELELEGSESETITFLDIDTEDLDPGEYEHGIFSEDDSETGTLTIRRPAEFLVSDLDPQDVTVTQGDLIDVSATIENVGEATATQTVEFRIDDDPLADQELELDGGASETVSFQDIDTEDLEPGDYEHGVFTDDDSETAILTIEAVEPEEPEEPDDPEDPDDPDDPEDPDDPDDPENENNNEQVSIGSQFFGYLNRIR